MNRHFTPETSPPPVAAFQAVGGRPVAAQFKAARRHSRRVRFLRVFLPAAVLVGGGLAAAVAYFDPLKIAMDLPFDLGRVSLSGSRVMMELPKLSGFTEDNRGYRITAKSASQDVLHPDQIDLEQIEARLELAEKGWASLTATAGQYNTKSQQMVLSNGIRVDTSAGYGGKLEVARIDAKTGILVSDRPVELNYLDGRLTADNLQISQKDARALLTGNVHLEFRMPPPKTDDAGGAGKPPSTTGSITPAPAASTARAGQVPPVPSPRQP